LTRKKKKNKLYSTSPVAWFDRVLEKELTGADSEFQKMESAPTPLVGRNHRGAFANEGLETGC
jgi:hypothetical protein